MKYESQLKVQAWLDGELSPADLPEVLRRVREDPETAALARELKLSRQWLAAGETVRPLPETREFFWSRVSRELKPREIGERASEAAPRWRLWLHRLVPAAALVALLAVMLTPPEAAPRSAGVRPAEVDTPLDDLGSFTFRSDSERMTVVWVNSF